MQQLRIEWLGETGVDDTYGESFFGGEPFGQFDGERHHGAEGPDLDLRSFAQHFGFTERDNRIMVALEYIIKKAQEKLNKIEL